jgi:hypothetical protein
MIEQKDQLVISLVPMGDAEVQVPNASYKQILEESFKMVSTDLEEMQLFYGNNCLKVPLEDFDIERLDKLIGGAQG